MRPFYKLVVALFLFAFVLDFRGEQPGGQAIQYVYAGIALTAAYLVVILGGVAGKLASLRTATLWFSIYALVASFSSYFYEIDLAIYLRVAAPFLLMLSAMLVVNVAIKYGLEAEWFYRMMIWAGFVSTVWTIRYALVERNIGLSEMRYQILSPAIPFLFAAGLSGILVSKTVKLLSLLALVLSLTLGVLSITRSLILMYLLSTATALAMIFWLRRSSPVESIAVTRRMVLIAAVVVVAMIGSFIARPALLETWVHRFLWYRTSEFGGDPTAYTRIAEWRGMWEAMRDEPLTWIWGRGWGGGYFWSAHYYAELRAYAEEIRFTSPMWLSGHSVWVYIAFSGGSVGLAAFTIGAHLVAGKIWHTLRELRARAALASSELVVTAVVALVSYTSQMFTSNPLGERLGGVFIGASLGLLYWAHHDLLGIQSQAPYRTAVLGRPPPRNPPGARPRTGPMPS